MTTGTDPLLQWLSNAGSLGILAFITLAWLRGWIYSAATFNREIGVRDQTITRLIGERDAAQREAREARQDRRDDVAALREQLIEERKRYEELDRRFHE